MKYFVILIVVLVVGCGSSDDPPKELFLEGKVLEPGQIVYTKLGNDPAQIRVVYPRSNTVNCRVLSGRHNRDGVFSKDSYEGEYTVVGFYLFELTREKK